MIQKFHKITTGGNQIYVWKVISKLNELLNNPLITSTDKTKLASISSEKRKIEILATNIALRKIFNSKISLNYLPSGKPFISESKHISISHSNKYIAIVFGEENIGLDIEKPHKKMLKLIPRILSDKEYKEYQINPTKEFACKLWGAKESILKYIGDKNINYRNDIQIETTELIKAKYIDQDFDIVYEMIDEMILTYITKA